MAMIRSLFVMAAALSLRTFAQPAAPATPDLPCTARPGNSEVTSAPDKDGFVSLFDGTSFTGWWHDCQSEDGQNNRKTGGVWRVDPKAHAIYSNQRGKGEGSLLATNRKFGNHEIILEVWPSWGNDGGLLHRTTDAGKSFQTVIDYYDSACIGGAYPQEYEYLGEFYKCSYWFHKPDQIMAGNDQPKGIDYRKFDLKQLWNPNGWNEMRVKFWGNPPRHQTWLRRAAGATPADTAQWTEVLDTTWPEVFSKVDTSGYIGLQVHYGTYWNYGSKGNWYRRIRIRALDGNGNPVQPPRK